MSEYEPQGQSKEQIASQKLVLALADAISIETMRDIPVGRIRAYMDKPASTFSTIVQTKREFWELASLYTNMGEGERQRRFFIERLVIRPDGSQNDIALRYDFAGNDVAVNERCVPYKIAQRYMLAEKVSALTSPHEIEDAFAPLFDIRHDDSLPIVASLFTDTNQKDAEIALKQHYNIIRNNLNEDFTRQGSRILSLLGKVSLKFWPK